MQNVWHYSPLAAGIGIAPAPVVAIGFAVGAGPIQRRFGRTLPAVVGTVTMALAALYWVIAPSGSHCWSRSPRPPTRSAATTKPGVSKPWPG